MSGIRSDLERIEGANTLEEIRAVVRRHSAKASGDAAALYSGRVGNVSATDLAVEHAKSTRAAIINNTARGRFLANDQIKDAIEESTRRILVAEGIDADLSVKLAGDFLYGDAKAPRNSPTSIFNCLWCEASRDFAASISGDVKVIAVNASPHRVFAQVEIPTALQNPNVRSLGGLPLDTLRTIYAQHGVEGVLERVQALYAEEAARVGLLPAPAADPMAPVRRAPGMKLNVSQVAAKGLGVVSAAVTLHDGVTSVRHAAQLRDQGNDTGAQSHIVGAVSRNVGGWGGVALGASAGAAITSETGPGAFVGGAVGGIAGAVAGDKLAAWIDHHRIHQQTDSHGRRWHFDPEHPAQGWTRTVTGELDTQATVDRGIPIYRQQTLTAPPELADRLNYQASSTAVELALSSPPKAQDPNILSSMPQDHRPGNLYEGDWRRNTVDAAWSRQVTDSHVGVSMQRFQTEIADPHQAAELDRRAQAVEAKNLETAPAAIAANYQAVYEQFGWSRHGEMPAAVQAALPHAARTASSPVKSPITPEQTYTDAMTDQFLAALQAGDRDGMRRVAKEFAESDTGKQERADVVREIAEEQRALPGRDHPLFTQAMQHLEDLGPETARYRDEPGMERIAGAIAFEAKRRHMGGIDAIAPNQDGELVATWKNPGNTFIPYAATVDPTLAAIQPLDRSFQQLSQETMEQAQQALQQEQTQSLGRGMSR